MLIDKILGPSSTTQVSNHHPENTELPIITSVMTDEQSRNNQRVNTRGKEGEDGKKKNKEIKTQPGQRCQKYLLCSKFPGHGTFLKSNSNPIQRDESALSDKITKFVSDTREL